MLALLRLLSAVCLFFLFTLGVAGAATETKDAGISAVTPDECDTLGKQLAEDFNAEKLDVFFGRMAKTAFTQSVFDGFVMPEAERQQFEQELGKSVVEGLTEKMQQFKKAKYLRTLEVDGGKRVLLRLTASDFAVTYVAFAVAKNEAGSLCWVDAFGYTMAETISDGLRRYLLFVSQGKLTRPRNLAEAAIYSNGRQFVQKLTRMQKLFAKGDYDSALRVIDQLPDELRNAKFVLCQRVQAAQKLGEEVYIKAIEAWEDAYPGDPSVNLVAIDGHLLRKSYPDVVRCATALENQLKGTDGLLCFAKAHAMELDHMPDAARAAAEEGLKVEPDFSDNYTILLKLALEERDFPGAVRILRSIEKSLPDEDPKRMIPATKNSEAFCKSEEFRTWMKARF